MRKSLILLLFLLAPPLPADDTPILVPLFYNGPGAYGSYWWTHVRFENHMPVALSSPGVLFSFLCAIPEGCVHTEVRPGEIGAVLEPQSASGLLLYAPAEHARLLAFQGRFGSGQDLATNGSQLPIVREHEFTRGAVRLPDVMLYDTLQPSRLRTTLRIYGVDAIEGTRVRVEIRSWTDASGQPMASREYTLAVQPSPAAKPLYPAFTAVALQTEFPFELLRGSRFNVTIVPLALPSGEVPRIWAFVSTVENATQDVSIQSPQ